MATKGYVFTAHEVASLLSLVGEAIDPDWVLDPGIKSLVYKCQDMHNSYLRGTEYSLRILPPD